MFDNETSLKALDIPWNAFHFTSTTFPYYDNLKQRKV
jgi:hypothetical protein